MKCNVFYEVYDEKENLHTAIRTLELTGNDLDDDILYFEAERALNEIFPGVSIKIIDINEL
jgi:hypothetical protein